MDKRYFKGILCLKPLVIVFKMAIFVENTVCHRWTISVASSFEDRESLLGGGLSRSL